MTGRYPDLPQNQRSFLFVFFRFLFAGLLIILIKNKFFNDNRKKILDKRKNCDIIKLTINVKFLIFGGIIMNNSGIKKINTAGTVGYVISILLSVAVIACMVFTGIAAAGAVAISKEDVNVLVATDIDIDSKGNILNKLDRFIKVGDIEKLSELAKDGANVNVSDRNISEIKVSMQGNSMKINAKTNEIHFSATKIFVALIFTFVWLGITAVCVHMLTRLMKALKKCETPFSQDVIKRMTRFAYWLVPAVVFSMINKCVWSGIFSNSYSFTLDIGSVLLVAVIYLLVIIFRHGALLQRESDETL